jgi:hypothetical protein
MSEPLQRNRVEAELIAINAGLSSSVGPLGVVRHNTYCEHVQHASLALLYNHYWAVVKRLRHPVKPRIRVMAGIQTNPEKLL